MGLAVGGPSEHWPNLLFYTKMPEAFRHSCGTPKQKQVYRNLERQGAQKLWCRRCHDMHSESFKALASFYCYGTQMLEGTAIVTVKNGVSHSSVTLLELALVALAERQPCH